MRFLVMQFQDDRVGFECVGYLQNCLSRHSDLDHKFRFLPSAWAFWDTNSLSRCRLVARFFSGIFMTSLAEGKRRSSGSGFLTSR